MRLRQAISAVIVVVVTVVVVALDRRGSDEADPTPIGDSLEEPTLSELSPLIDPSGVAEPHVAIVEGTTTSSWFCPGVPGADPTIAGRVVVANPSEVDLTATVTILGSAAPPVEEAVAVPARGRAIVDITGRVRSPFVSAVVEILGPVGSVEQTTTHPAGDATVACARRPAREWHFADGFTGDDSRDSIVVTNPYPDAAVVDVTFVTRESGRTPSNLKGYVVPARSTVGISIADEGARNETVLAVSVRVTAGAVVAGRSQHYLGRGRLGYTMRLGSPGTGGEWWFADGQKVAGLVEQFVVYNPGDDDRAVSFVFLAGSEVFVEPLTVSVPAGSVAVVDTAGLAQVPAGRYGVVVSVSDERLDSDSGGVVVEQIVSRREGNSVGTSVVVGAPGAMVSTVWSAPSGTTPGLVESLVVLNATPNAATLRVAQVGPAGAVAIPGLESIELSGGGVLTLSIPEGLPVSELIIESSEPIVVQRLLSRGGGLVGRASALALPHLPSPRR